MTDPRNSDSPSGTAPPPDSGALAPARRSASLMAVGTLLSRLTGFVRTAALFAALGVTNLADAYNTANTIPNILFVLVTGGTLSAVLVPMLSQARDARERRQRAEAVGGAVVLVTALASIAVALAAPLVIRLYAGSKEGFATFAPVAITWLWMFAPQILCYGISVYAVAVLNAQGRLALAGIAPVATNIITIGAIAGYLALDPPNPPDPATVETLQLVVLGVGTTLGVAAMAALQYLGARRVVPGLTLRPRLNLADPTVRQLWRLGRWTFAYVVFNQIGLTVVVRLANATNGGLTAYQRAFDIMQLPFAIVAVSIFSATFPRLARARDTATFARTFSSSLRISAVLMIPAAVGLVVLAQPIADLLADYGRASGEGAAFVASAVRWFGLALVPFTAFQLLTRSYYSLADTRTPALVNAVVNAINIVVALAAAALVVTPQARIAGLVLAFALSYVGGVALLGTGLAKRRPGVWRGSGRAVATAAAASALMGAVLLGVTRAWPEPAVQVLSAVRTLALVGIGAAVYGLALVLARSRELAEVRGVRLARTRPGDD